MAAATSRGLAEPVTVHSAKWGEASSEAPGREKHWEFRTTMTGASEQRV